ncbi:unnamed protein product [Microthlaspi erraticum]|uniref:Jacalin-type lectin domain-containing protein n=1 Tax=Microthlaspi erraticum TaxID=1685480 RepID=A0A6D2HMP8_9BRAS|nr:unnamed protein product [Microthlaspi erraticum]
MEGPLGVELDDIHGVAWDDGPHDDVETIQIYCHDLGINAVKFGYRDGTHGQRRPDPRQETMAEFLLKDGEYLTMVYAECGLSGIKTIQFKTNKRNMECGAATDGTEEPVCFGSTDGTAKIVGFHGVSGDQFLQQIGVHWAPV